MYVETMVVIATPDATRRLKFLFALAAQVAIVHPDWISACLHAQKIVSMNG
jgi:hypothetical protein